MIVRSQLLVSVSIVVIPSGYPAAATKEAVQYVLINGHGLRLEKPLVGSGQNELLTGSGGSTLASIISLLVSALLASPTNS